MNARNAMDGVRGEERRLAAEMTPIVGREAATLQARLFAANAGAFGRAYGVYPVNLMRRVQVLRGDEAGAGVGTLNQAMYPVGLKQNIHNAAEFTQRVLANPNGKPCYYGWKGEGVFDGWEIRLSSLVVQHIRNGHEDTLADLGNLEKAFNNIHDIAISNRKKSYGEVVLAHAKVGGQSYGIAFSPQSNGAIYVETFFKGSDAAVGAWIAGNKKGTSTGSAEETEVSPAMSPDVTSGKSLETELTEHLNEVKASRLNQQQNKAAIIVRGDELGVPEGADM